MYKYKNNVCILHRLTAYEYKNYIMLNVQGLKQQMLFHE